MPAFFSFWEKDAGSIYSISLYMADAMLHKKVKYKLISAFSFIIFIIFWELITDVFKIFQPYSLPSPAKVFLSFIEKMSNPVPDGSLLYQHILISLYISFLGFISGAAVGVPLGILMAWHRKFELMVKPIFDLLRTIPPVGWIPIMILLLGIGTQAKVAVIVVASFIPCVINAYTGIKQTNPIHLWVGHTFGATNRQLLFKIAIPTALPFIFTGLKISLSISWMCLVAAELLAATRGLGYMIQIARMVGRADIIIVGMLSIGIIGSLISALLESIEHHFVRGA
jgi:NitT/TauT family transport system permease protein/taurine transport system permease protein